jgi:hypothetical protein
MFLVKDTGYIHSLYAYEAKRNQFLSECALVRVYYARMYCMLDGRYLNHHENTHELAAPILNRYLEFLR